MRSATAFLPSSMITLTNLVTSGDPNFGSGRMSRFGTSRRRGISHLSWLQSLSEALRRLATAAPCKRAATYSAARLRRPGWNSGGLRTLRAVLLAGLLAVLYALRVHGAAH